MPQPTLTTWVSELRIVPGMQRRPPEERIGANRLRAVQKSAGLDGPAMGALLRREGLQLAHLTAWRQVTKQALERESVRPKASPSVEVERVQELERQPARKGQALTETAALL